MEERSDYFFKIVLVGKSNVGKTSFLVRVADDQFKSNYSATIGVDFRFKNLTTSSKKKVKLQIVG